METLIISSDATKRAGGTRANTITGVVASGNLEILLERVLEGTQCEVIIKTPISGFDAIWHAVVNDFVERYSPGGLRISINDGGARPDTVSLRLAQGLRLIEATK